MANTEHELDELEEKDPTKYRLAKLCSEISKDYDFGIFPRNDVLEMIRFKEDNYFMFYESYFNLYGEEDNIDFLVVIKDMGRIAFKHYFFNEYREEIVYIYLNALERIDEDNIVLIFDDDDLIRPWFYWMKDAIQQKKYTTPKNKHKNISIFSYEELLELLHNDGIIKLFEVFKTEDVAK